MKAIDICDRLFADQKSACNFAKRLESETGERCYVAWHEPNERWLVCETMPLVGRWMDSDGIMHGR